jgi:TolA-binding protein
MAAAGLTLLSACATKGDLRDLTRAIEAQSARTDATLASLGIEINALQDTLETQSGLVVDTRGGVTRDLREIRDQLTRLEQLTGQVQRAVRQLAQRMQQELETSRLPPSSMPRDADSLRTRLVDDEGVGARMSDPDELYDVAYREFQRGSFFTARAGFERFLEMAADHPRAPGVHFYLGDIAEQEGRLDDALEAYLRVQELFPSSSMVPRALYRAGKLEADRGNDDEARELLQRLVNTYPDDDVAELARELLREIG